MSSSMSIDEKFEALIDIGYACYTIPKFRGQEEEFPGWLSKVERVFSCCNLNDQEKFKVVISRLRGYALQWWNTYKFKRKRRRKEKVRTWKKLSSKLKGAFSPYTYIPMEESISIKPTAPFPSTPQKNQAPQDSLPSQSEPTPLSKSIPRCSKCQGLGHLTTDCPNSEVITLNEWEAVREEEKQEEPKEVLTEDIQDTLEETQEEVTMEANKEEVELHSEETQEEIIIPADEGELLELTSTGSKYVSLIPTPPHTNQFGESLILSPNSTLALSLTPFKEWVFNDPKQPRLPFSNHPITFPQNHSIRTKQDLFAWLILFQPFTSPYHPPYRPMLSFLCFEPLTKKFCHKDKWKERTLVL